MMISNIRYEEFANRYFKQKLLDLLTSNDSDENFVGYQNITCLLD